MAGSLRLIEIAKIQDSPHNPPRRTKAGRKLQALAASILDIGLIYPVVLTRELILVDGHRRKAVALSLGWKRIPAFVIDHDFAHAYGQVNATSMHLTGNDLLGVYLSNPEALTERQRRFPEKIERTVGRAWVNKLYHAGQSYSTYGIAVRLCRYCHGRGMFSDGQLEEALCWILRHGMQNTVRTLIDQESPASSIWRAVEEDRPKKVWAEATRS